MLSQRASECCVWWRGTSSLASIAWKNSGWLITGIYRRRRNDWFCCWSIPSVTSRVMTSQRNYETTWSGTLTLKWRRSGGEIISCTRCLSTEWSTITTMASRCRHIRTGPIPIYSSVTRSKTGNRDNPPMIVQCCQCEWPSNVQITDEGWIVLLFSSGVATGWMGGSGSPQIRWKFCFVFKGVPCIICILQLSLLTSIDKFSDHTVSGLATPLLFRCAIHDNKKACMGVLPI